jgi:hypothetical protein
MTMADEPTTEIAAQPMPEEEPAARAEAKARSRRAGGGGRLRRITRPRGLGVGVWIGLLVTAGGFGLLAFTWSRVAGLVNVAQQIPYLVSGGMVGVGLILVGLLVVNLSVKRREALDRARQLEELRDALARLRAAVEGESEDQG